MPTTITGGFSTANAEDSKKLAGLIFKPVDSGDSPTPDSAPIPEPVVVEINDAPADAQTQEGNL